MGAGSSNSDSGGKPDAPFPYDVLPVSTAPPWDARLRALESVVGVLQEKISSLEAIAAFVKSVESVHSELFTVRATMTEMQGHIKLLLDRFAEGLSAIDGMSVIDTQQGQGEGEGQGQGQGQGQEDQNLVDVTHAFEGGAFGDPETGFSEHKEGEELLTCITPAIESAHVPDLTLTSAIAELAPVPAPVPEPEPALVPTPESAAPALAPVVTQPVQHMDTEIRVVHLSPLSGGGPKVDTAALSHKYHHYTETDWKGTRVQELKEALHAFGKPYPGSKDLAVAALKKCAHAALVV